MLCKQSLLRSKAGVTGVVPGQHRAAAVCAQHTVPTEPGFALWRAHGLLQPQSGSLCPFVEQLNLHCSECSSPGLHSSA